MDVEGEPAVMNWGLIAFSMKTVS